MSAPGRHLITHRAPDDLLAGAMRRAAARPSVGDRRAPRPRWVGPAALAATFLLGFLAGRGGGAEAPGERVVGVVEVAPQAQEAEPVGVGQGLVPVRLVFHAPEASAVGVAGTWNGWDPAASPLRSDGAGVFFGVVALPPGQHEYMFVVDGERWVTDPLALITVDDGFGRRNAVLEI